MKRDMNNKERRKVVVRGKKKTYTRTMLVKTAQDIGRRESLHQIKLEQANHQPSTMSKLLAKAKSGLKGVLPNRNVGALHALHPWQEHHLGTRGSAESGYRDRKADPGVPGPGSDHSLYAHLVGMVRDTEKATVGHRAFAGGEMHAMARRDAALSGAVYANGSYTDGAGSRLPNHEDINSFLTQPHYRRDHDGGLRDKYGDSNVTQVPQNPNRWVR